LKHVLKLVNINKRTLKKVAGCLIHVHKSTTWCHIRTTCNLHFVLLVSH